MKALVCGGALSPGQAPAAPLDALHHAGSTGVAGRLWPLVVVGAPPRLPETGFFSCEDIFCA